MLDSVLLLSTLALCIAGLSFHILDPALIFISALGLLLIGGVMSPDQVLAGFANPAVATIALLMVLANAMTHSSWLKWLSANIFEKSGRGMWRLLAPIAALSAFLANTVVVAFMLPAARKHTQDTHQGLSRYLMPISFAAILGGTCSLIGTSTNLVVHGMLKDVGDAGFTFFELARVGLPLTLLGIVYLSMASPKLMAKSKAPLDTLGANPREYLARLRVLDSSRFIGQPVDKLRELKGLFLVGIERQQQLISSVRPHILIIQGDVLIFAGLVHTITDLAAIAGFAVADEEQNQAVLEKGTASYLVEAVVSPSSPIVGCNIRELGFRKIYDAAVLGVHRHGQKVMRKIGDIIIQAGDTLLLLTGPDFQARWEHSPDFYLLSQVRGAPHALRYRDWLEPMVLAAVVISAGLGWLDLFQAAMAGVLALLISRRLSPHDVWSAWDIPTLIIIAASISLGEAVAHSPLLVLAMTKLTQAFPLIGPNGIIALLFIAAALFTECISNVAAAALLFPLAFLAHQHTGVDLHAVAAAVALGASINLLTPTGYHTNTIVAGAVGYTMKDFVRLGLPLKIILILVGSLLIPLAWNHG